MTTPDTPPEHSPSLRIERDGPVGRILLDRPDALNALDLATAHLLLRAVLELDSDPACSVILVESTGRAFCTGGDVSAIMSAPRPDEYLRDLATTAAEAFHLLETTGKVVVCAIDGMTAGAGIAFALAADIVVATPAAAFLSAYGDVGLVPDCGVTDSLPRAIGRRRALDFVLSGRPVRASEALEWQLVTEVVPRAELAARVRERVDALAARPAHVAAAAKRLLRTDAVHRIERAAEETETLVELLAVPATRALLDAEHERQRRRAERPRRAGARV
ncbi:enoyl-CoA hydratase/isomerase family protein [Rathayibacter sp. VKM Ac-2759]|uniref:enoyl-CoA hydratase/isomerase family protein n=1 Tax=Rathayibacter sp. VKM Ac-2759 TaxID=2609252 RepID=UPI001319B5FD|nr:enoyl-CoA hydratase/isomerase family protein [Rathayibacter sp. VKM Ac-2759]QHC67566.1 enoyl-CoA hydratase/isomerase family protein [Rathayibacter sp. VKM Ac-2759]